LIIVEIRKICYVQQMSVYVKLRPKPDYLNSDHRLDNLGLIHTSQMTNSDLRFNWVTIFIPCSEASIYLFFVDICCLILFLKDPSYNYNAVGPDKFMLLTS